VPERARFALNCPTVADVIVSVEPDTVAE
jgi:hypothetical protein